MSDASKTLTKDGIKMRARRIKVFAFDVDGVCTDGRLYYGPAGEALHAFYARDGLGIVMARQAGLVLAAITGRRSPSVQARLSELKVPHILQGVDDKAAVMSGLLESCGASWDEAAFVGDDVNDLPCLTRVGLSFAVADAMASVAAQVHVVTRAAGGRGGLREALDLVLDAQRS
jgi:3-deoxy-D-manno-octulosonate 8-phosphate phosphatase (KDO 8-P phosphatase)